MGIEKSTLAFLFLTFVALANFHGVVVVDAAEGNVDPFQGGPKERESHTYQGNFPLAELGEKWEKLEQKQIYYDQDENEFTVTYLVHENITESDATVSFWDKNCTDLDNELFRRDGLDDIDIDVDNPGTMKYAFKLDLGKLRDNPYDLWLDDAEAETSRLMMCARIQLMAVINGETYEVNYEETVFQLDFDMSASGFTLKAFQVAPKNKETTVRNKEYNVTAYLCDPNEPSVEITNALFRQGELISVCVTPTPESLEEGVRMDSIRSFTWYQYEPNPIQQVAVKNGAAASNFLTVLNCIPGSIYCSFTSILFAQYFAIPLPEGNYVEGSGVAFLRFEVGSEGTTSRSRVLAKAGKNRYLQEDVNGLEPGDIGVVVQTEAVEDDGYGKLRTADAGDDGWPNSLLLLILCLIVNTLILST